jgi:tyrosine-protein kinase Etk/Wzc
MDGGYDDSAYPEGRQSAIGQENAFKVVGLSILKRPWYALATLAAVMLPVGYYFSTIPPQYSATAVVSVIQRSVTNAMGLLPTDPLRNQESDNFYVSILESNAYYKRLAESIIAEHPEWEASKDSIQGLVRRSVSYSRKAKTGGFLAIKGTGTTREMAQLMAVHALEGFKEITIELRREETANVSKFIDNQLAELNTNLGVVESELQDFLAERNLRVDQITQGIDSELRELEKSYGVAEAQRDIAKRQIDSYSRQINERLTAFLGHSNESAPEDTAGRLRQRLIQIGEMDLDSLSQDSTSFRQIQQERKDILVALLNTASGSYKNDMAGAAANKVSIRTLSLDLEQQYLAYERAQVQFGYFEDQIWKFHQSHPDLPKDILEFFNISRNKLVLNKTIEILVEMREKKRIELASETGGITVIDKPDHPVAVSQRMMTKLLLALLGALVLSALVCYMIDLLDNTVQGEADIQRMFGLPVLGSIPVLDSNKQSMKSSRSHKPRSLITPVGSNGQVNPKLLTNYSESSPIAEAYRAIKTGVLFTARDRERNVFVITSPVASDGKSITTFNIAVSLAQGGKRVLIMDADLRRASQHKLFGIKRTPGLSDVLMGELDIHQGILPGPIPGVFILPAGKKVNNPAEMIASHTMEKLIDSIKNDYDIVLIDTPPITPCMDSRHLALIVGGMFLVVRAEGTKLNVLEHSINLCKRVDVEILGVIVNHATFRYSYGYYYLYQRYNAYGYYYSGYQYYYSQDPETGEKIKKKRRKSADKPPAAEVHAPEA